MQRFGGGRDASFFGDRPKVQQMVIVQPFCHDITRIGFLNAAGPSFLFVKVYVAAVLFNSVEH